MVKLQSITVVFALSIFYLVGCQSPMSGFIKGEGEVISQDASLEPIHGIHLNIAGDVILTQGTSQNIVLEGQKNILDNIQRDVRNGIWNIEYDNDVGDAKPVVIHITIPLIDEVGVSGSGTIKSINKFTGADHMEINVAGSGNITLDYSADVTDLNLSGSGKINLSGSSDELSIAISGSGDVSANTLQTNDCEIHISGSGDASVNANRSLEASISGSGDVEYSGNATVNTHVSGSGGVNKIN